MNQLPPEDLAHLRTAQGWMELDNHTEANEELGKISPDFHGHPDVLEVRWKVFASVQKWDECLSIADALIDHAPERLSGWMTKSIALHGLDRIQEAFNTLSSVADRFSHVPVIPYELACYSCRLGRLQQAKQWLDRALRSGDADRLKAMALEDADLKPLWDELR